VGWLTSVLASLVAAGAASGPPAPPHPVHLTIAASGDLLIHSPVFDRARADGGGRTYDFRRMLRPLRPVIARADLALCHMETPMGPGPPHGYPLFNTPSSLARAIRATGWDVCDTASNHTLDGGAAGVAGTIHALERAGVRHTGSAIFRSGSERVVLLRARGVRVAFLAYSAISNGQRAPHPWSLNVARTRRIVADARRARRAGARVVIVNVHWGTECVRRPSPGQLALARGVLGSGAVTAIVGQHVHVVQAIRSVRGRPVVFGEGNLLSNQSAAAGLPAGSQDGLVALLRITVRGGRARLARVDYVPTYVRHPDFAVLAGRVVPAASYSRTVAAAGRGRTWGPLPR